MAARRTLAILLLAVVAMLAAGWIYGAITNWSAIAARPVRLAYVIVDCAIVIPIGITAAVGLLGNKAWAPVFTGLALGALLFDVAHGVFYLVWDNYFRIPMLVAFGILLVTAGFATVGTVIIVPRHSSGATRAHMNRRSAGDILMLVIGGITVVSAGAQIVAPARALSSLGLPPIIAAQLMLALASSFSALFGLALLHTVWTRAYDHNLLLWIGLAKFAGPIVLGVGAASHLVLTRALWVAAYDALAGSAILWFRTAVSLRSATSSRLEANRGQAQAAKLET